jgi:hypothetical protein
MGFVEPCGKDRAGLDVPALRSALDRHTNTAAVEAVGPDTRAD